MSYVALVTAANYKTYAGITGTALDAALALLIPQAEVQIRQLCGRNLDDGFTQQTRTELYSGGDSEAIQLREWPVSSVTSVTLVDDQGSTTAYANYAASTNQQWLPSPCWPMGFNNISVVYVGGWGAATVPTTIPASLQYAVCRIVDRVIAQRGRDPALTSEKIGSYQYALAAYADIRGEVDDILMPFRSGGV